MDGNHDWRARINNYEGKRHEYARGELAYIHDAQGNPTVALKGTHGLPDWQKSLFILDNGTTARIMYVAGWKSYGDHGELDVAWLQDLPMNGGNRPDNGRQVDMSGWELGPKKTYHLKVTQSD
jgi:hypothetical protein